MAEKSTQVDASIAASFIARWKGVTASELSTAQSFTRELCTLLKVPPPHPTPELDYMFERPITFVHGDGATSNGRIDCYRRGHFVLEAKKLKTGVHLKGFDDAMLRARNQAEGYARALPAQEGRPPFLMVVDVGNVIEVYAEFSRTGATYTPFPDPRNHRIALADLVRDDVRATLRTIWLDPDRLNPALVSARVTRQVSAQLAELAKSLEASGHRPEHVAAFLTRCLFSMFAEDVGLLPDDSFLALLKRHAGEPVVLRDMLQALWGDMDRGGFSPALAKKVLQFNGKLFKAADSEGYSLLLTREQVDLLLAAASSNWREVEPAIFGTLLERALSPNERHALGAHYTPRAYVERLVLPTIIDPLRSEWADAQAAALTLAREAAELEAAPPQVKTKKDFAALDRHNAAVRAKWSEARQQVRDFLHRLCTLRVLDPACGSANFLYVTLEHLKRLEGEVLNQLDALGDTQDALDLGRETVTLRQLRGVEINERAAALAELVLWIGFLQWRIRTNGHASVAEPVVHDYGNIEHRDAVLAYDLQEPITDEQGQALTRWDGVTFKPHPATGQPVPDELARVVQWRYLGPRPAQWPQADFIVGNPPFIGNKRMRVALGDGYVDALRAVWPEVPESADFVMYWWHKAAQAVRDGQAERFGLITTNSLTMIFNRRVIEAHQSASPPLSLVYAVPDHPWVDTTDGAAVRISMSVGVRGIIEGKLQTVEQEREAHGGEVAVDLATRRGLIHADLKVGANVAGAHRLRANDRLSNRGVIPHGAGFIVTPEEAYRLGLGKVQELQHHIRPYRNGRDLTATPRGLMVIDLFGLSAEEVRKRFPEVYQWLLERVKPERDMNPERSRRENWWLFARPNTELRSALAGLPRYIATGQVAKHRVFQWLDASILPDDKLIAIASADALHLGVLSSAVHMAWALATGGRMGVGNDPVYSKSTCFEAFPFPDLDPSSALAQRIRSLAEQIDAHRKAQQAQYADASLTSVYNVLAKLRRGTALNPSERNVHEHGLVGLLKSLHDELDSAVLEAYGWSLLSPVPWADDEALSNWTNELLDRLVALNAQRAAEESAGVIRWVRPDFQDPSRQPADAMSHQTGLIVEESEVELSASAGVSVAQKSQVQQWPPSLPEQVRAVAQLLDASAAPLSVEAIEASFKGKGPWKKGLPRILETLEAVGRARYEGSGWRG